MKIKSTFFLAILIPAFFSCSDKENAAQELVLENTSSIDLVDKAIVVKKDELKFASDNLYPLIISSAGDTIPSQLDDIDNDGNWDELFFVVNIKAGEKLTQRLSWIEQQPEYVKRTNVRLGKRDSQDTPVKSIDSDTLYAENVPGKIGYQSYQTDGPNWENDKAGFRHYFDGRNSKDYFGKTTTEMVLEEVGVNDSGAVEDNYHVMADWGRDVLSTANSVGIGGIGIVIGDSVYRVGGNQGDTVVNFENAVFNIVEEGPVRSILQFKYNNWQPQEERSYTATETVSIWPGMYAYKNSVKVNGLKGDENLLVGLVNNNTDKPLGEIQVNDKFVVLHTHDKQTYEKTWYLGMALILPKDKFISSGDAPKTGKLSTSYYGKMKLENDEPIDYFAVAAWELSDQNFADSTYFVDHVTNLANQLAAEVEVQVK